MDNNLLLILVIILILAILVMIALIGYFGYRFLKIREKEAGKKSDDETLPAKTVLIPEVVRHSKDVSPELLKSLRARKEEPRPGLYCVDHPDEIAKGLCAISAEPYCEHCLTKQGDVRISKKYLDLYLDNEWIQVVMIQNNESNQDLKDRIMKVKRSLWTEKSLPLIVQGHFKINVQEDLIEEYTVVMSRVSDKDFVQKELSFVA